MIKLKIWSLIYFQDSETMKLMFVSLQILVEVSWQNIYLKVWWVRK